MSHNLVSGSADAVVEVPVTSTVADGPVQVSVAAGSLTPTHSLPFTVLMKSGAPATRIDVREHPVFRALSALYESVDLLSFDATITVFRSDKQFVAWGFHTSSNSYKTPEAILTAPMAGYIQSAVNGQVTEQVSLPSNHSFGRRLKGLNLTTRPVVFTVICDNKTALAGIVRGVIRVRFSGVAPIPALLWDDGQPKAGQAADSIADLLDVDEDDDEPAPTS